MKFGFESKSESIYQSEFKHAFLTSKYSVDTQRAAKTLFKKTAEMEKRKNKDLYSFNQEELTEAFKLLKAKTIRSLQDKISKVERYIDFAKQHGKTEVNYATLFNSKDKLETLLDQEAEENMIFDKDQIMEMAMNADNSQDGVILALLFDGVSHKNEFEELIHLTKDNVNEDHQEIVLADRVLPISTETLILVRRALEEDTYVSIKGEASRRYKIADGINVLRGLRGKSKVKAQIISQRILRIAEIFDYPYLNATTISYSGQLHYAMEFIHAGKNIDDVVPIIMKRFDINDNSSSRFYLKTRIEDFMKRSEIHILKSDEPYSNNILNVRVTEETQTYSAVDALREIESLTTTVPEQIEITETEKEQVMKSRVGQSTFKKALLSIEKKCSLCGVSDERFLVASHIKPWSQSNHQERLDKNNGLLLCPNHDALFDKGYISFDKDGTILISSSLDEATKIFLNINESMSIRVNEEQREYMKWHREKIFK